MVRVPVRQHSSRLTLAVGATCVAVVLAGCSSSSATHASGHGAVAVGSGALIKSGQITFCDDISSPPLSYFDANLKPVGAEIELGNALATELGVAPHWSNTSFNGIIPALQTKRCDAIISDMYIKPDRAKVVDFVPYMYASDTLLVASQNKDISGASDLCGKKAAGETGTTIVQYLTDQSSTCKSGGKSKIDIRQFTKDSDALQQLRLGLVDCYGTSLETAAYVMKSQPGTFKLAGSPFNRHPLGAGTRKDAPALHQALNAALAALEKNGQYSAILTKWNLAADDITKEQSGWASWPLSRAR